MIVEILRSCERTGVVKGQHYNAIVYALDPLCKVSLMELVDIEGTVIGDYADCNEYNHNVKLIKEN